MVDREKLSQTNLGPGTYNLPSSIGQAKDLSPALDKSNRFHYAE